MIISIKKCRMKLLIHSKNSVNDYSTYARVIVPITGVENPTLRHISSRDVHCISCYRLKTTATYEQEIPEI